MKNLLTPAGIEPATFRFVAQQWGYAGLLVSVLLNMSYTDMQQSGSSEVFTVRSSVEFCCHLAVSHLQAHPVTAV